MFKIKNYSIVPKDFFRNKAVSDGAISFYLDHFVRTRVSKVTYGTFITKIYDPNAPDHRSRSRKVYTSISGEERIGDFFDIILPRVSYLIPFLKSMLFKRPLFVEYPSFGNEGVQKFLFLCFRIYSLCPNFYRVRLVLPWKHRDSKVERR